jgi:hypothetical protein
MKTLFVNILAPCFTDYVLAQEVVSLNEAAYVEKKESS